MICCELSPNGQHEMNWSKRKTDWDGFRIYTDVQCKHCKKMICVNSFATDPENSEAEED